MFILFFVVVVNSTLYCHKCFSINVRKSVIKPLSQCIAATYNKPLCHLSHYFRVAWSCKHQICMSMQTIFIAVISLYAPLNPFWSVEILFVTKQQLRSKGSHANTADRWNKKSDTGCKEKHGSSLEIILIRMMSLLLPHVIKSRFTFIGPNNCESHYRCKVICLCFSLL